MTPTADDQRRRQPPAAGSATRRCGARRDVHAHDQPVDLDHLRRYAVDVDAPAGVELLVERHDRPVIEVGARPSTCSGDWRSTSSPTGAQLGDRPVAGESGRRRRRRAPCRPARRPRRAAASGASSGRPTCGRRPGDRLADPRRVLPDLELIVDGHRPDPAWHELVDRSASGRSARTAHPGARARTGSSGTSTLLRSGRSTAGSGWSRRSAAAQRSVIWTPPS